MVEHRPRSGSGFPDRSRSASRDDDRGKRFRILRRLYLRGVGLWLRARDGLTMGLFGVSGATTVATVQHAIQTCSGGSCTGCGRCAAALVAAAAAASGGIAGRTRGMKRWRLIGLVAAVGLLLYGLLEAWKRGWLSG